MPIDFPRTWRLGALGDLDGGTRRTIDPGEHPNEVFEYYSIPAFQEGQSPLKTKGAEIASTKLLLEERSVLFGKLNPRVEKVWRVRASTGLRQIGSTEWLPIVPNGDIDPDFLYFLCWSDQVMHVAKGQVSGSTPSRQRVDPTAFYRIRVAVPPLDEQRQIATVLSAVQRAIERNERLVALTAELKKALMHKLFTEGIRSEPLKQTKIGPVPQSWSIDRLDRAGDVIYGIQAAVANNVRPVGTRILTNKNIDLDGNIVVDKQSYFELRTERHRRTLLKKGDILFNWRSGSKEHVGKTAYFDLEGDWTHSSFILRIRPREEVNGRFLFHYLMWLRESKYFVKLHNYAVNAKFNKSAMNALPTLLPDRPEQGIIAAALDEAIKKFNVHLRQRAALTRLARDLLHQLMTAQVRVHDLDLSALEEAGQELVGAG